MSNKTKFISTLAIGGVLVSSVAGFMVVNAQSATAVDSSSLSNTNTNFIPKPNREQFNIQREAIQKALDEKNYEAWKIAVKNQPYGDTILAKVDTQDKFNLLAEAHKNVKTAHEAEQKVYTDLGLEGLMGPKKGKGRGMMSRFQKSTTITNQ